MATPSERKALLFFGLVAILGASVRVWRNRHSPASSAIAAAGHQSRVGSVTLSQSGRSMGHKSDPASRTRQPVRDSDAIVDLDRASASEIDALGVLPKGIARIIVADRDSFGPFGSMDEMRRIPFISASTLRKLAPRVTFSRVPRPRNTVVHPRSLPPGSPIRTRSRVLP